MSEISSTIMHGALVHHVICLFCRILCVSFAEYRLFIDLIHYHAWCTRCRESAEERSFTCLRIWVWDLGFGHSQGSRFVACVVQGVGRREILYGFEDLGVGFRV